MASAVGSSAEEEKPGSSTTGLCRFPTVTTDAATSTPGSSAPREGRCAYIKPEPQSVPRSENALSGKSVCVLGGTGHVEEAST